MRQRPGKMRNMADLRRRNAKIHEVKVPPVDYTNIGAYAFYIRENCRRADWAEELQWGFSSPQKRMMVYAFADQQDAMMFKLRFG